MSRRYPIEPLLAVLEARGMTRTAAGDSVGLHGSNLFAALERGLLVKAADRCATRVGLHPAEVWPSWADDALEDHGVECVECSVQFLPNRRGQRFCCTLCGHRHRGRRYWSERYADPATREYKRLYLAEYKARYRESINAQRRSEYRAQRESMSA
jgi:lambda repressor-like predicted transcriptional regulator